MSTIQQPCPSCRRLLEWPASATGRMVQCPACQSRFAVAGPTGSAAGASASPGQNPFSTPIGGAIDEPAPASFRPSNPYQPAAAVSTAGQTVSIGAFRIGQRSVEEIFGATWAIFKERWGAIVGIFVLTTIASIGVFVFSAIVNAAATKFIGEPVAGIINVATSFVTIPLSIWLYLGLTRVVLAVARDQPSPMNDVFAPAIIFFRFFGGGILATLAIGGVMAIIIAIGAGLAFLIGPEAMMFGVLGLGLLIVLPLLIASYWLLWSWPFVVADGQTNWLDAFRVAQKITMQNKLTSLLLLVLTAALGLGGVLACYVGQIVTTPLTTLMMAVGYLMITTQPIADPRMRQLMTSRLTSPAF